MSTVTDSPRRDGTAYLDKQPLARDLLPSIEAIASYTGEAPRRIRHLIATFNFPAKKVGGKIQSRKSWVDQFYAEPDQK
jgi:hypothetical protein